jgi:hypothetical protein
VYWGAGYLFSGFLGAITRGYAQFGNYAAWSVAVLFAGYIGYRALTVIGERKRDPIVRVKATEVARRLAGIAIYDVAQSRLLREGHDADSGLGAP